RRESARLHDPPQFATTVFTHEQQANIRAWDDKKFSTPARLLPIKSNMQAQIAQITYLSIEVSMTSEDLRIATTFRHRVVFG
ncbi:MAG TPA: hypothetical protein DDZ51_08995, partial [Planctomycetaceae bacterium]|nr:hypothetical protein [Planctomycetaceae bacterium]